MTAGTHSVAGTQQHGQPATVAAWRPRLLDLCCCAGGSSVGYARAGFEVVGTDVVDRPDYPYRFIRADVVDVLGTASFVVGFDAIHASPPCQAYSAPTKGTNAKRRPDHPDLIAPIRALLQATGLPFVIENVVTAPLRRDLMLCHGMFREPKYPAIQMHRHFEFGGGWPVPAQPDHPRHLGKVRGWRHGEYSEGLYVAAYGKGGGKATVEEIREAKGIDWTRDRKELCEALPPAYTEHIGRDLIRRLTAPVEVVS